MNPPAGGWRFTSLTGHVAQVEALAARMRTASAAGTPLDHGAYGLVGQVFAAAAAGGARVASDAVAMLSAGLSSTAAELRATEEGYSGVERTNRSRIGGAR